MEKTGHLYFAPTRLSRGLQLGEQRLPAAGLDPARVGLGHAQVPVAQSGPRQLLARLGLAPLRGFVLRPQHLRLREARCGLRQLDVGLVSPLSARFEEGRAAPHPTLGALGDGLTLAVFQVPLETLSEGVERDALLGLALQAALQQGGQILGHREGDLGHLAALRLEDHFAHVGPAVGRLAGDDLVEHGAQQVHIGPTTHVLARALGELRRHIAGRAPGQRDVGVSRGRRRRVGRALQRHAAAPVHHPRLAEVADHHVGRFEIEVHDAAAVREGHRVAHRHQGADVIGLLQIRGPPLGAGGGGVQQGLPGQALHPLHGHRRLPVRVVQIVDGDDIRVVQRARELGLGHEARLPLAAVALQAHLQRHQAVQAQLSRLVDDAHRASAQLLDDLVGLLGREGGHTHDRRVFVEGVGAEALGVEVGAVGVAGIEVGAQGGAEGALPPGLELGVVDHALIQAPAGCRRGASEAGPELGGAALLDAVEVLAGVGLGAGVEGVDASPLGRGGLGVAGVGAARVASAATEAVDDVGAAAAAGLAVAGARGALKAAVVVGAAEVPVAAIVAAELGATAGGQ